MSTLCMHILTKNVILKSLIFAVMTKTKKWFFGTLGAGSIKNLIWMNNLPFSSIQRSEHTLGSINTLKMSKHHASVMFFSFYNQILHPENVTLVSLAINLHHLRENVAFSNYVFPSDDVETRYSKGLTSRNWAW